MKDVLFCIRGNCVAVLAATALVSFTPADADFTIDLGDGTYGALQTYEVTHGSVSGQIAGFTISFDYDPMDSPASWASDMNFGISSDGAYFASWGGYDSYLFAPSTPWAFDGAGSAPAGTYTDTIVFGSPMDGAGLGSLGVGIMNGYSASGDVGYNNVTITFHEDISVPSGSCCIAGDCYDDVTQGDCAMNGGIFNGDGSVCDASSCESSANDECSGAVEIFLGINDFSTVGMTNSPDPWDPNCDAFGGIMNQDVWFTFYPTASGSYSFSTCNPSSFDTDLAVYDGDCEEMNQIACSGDGAGLAGCQVYYSYIPEVSLSAGSTYTIRIGGWDAAASGTGTLEIGTNLPGACCLAGDCFDDVSEVDCNATGGQWLGGGSTCEDGCPAGPADECGDAYSNEVFVGSNAFSTIGATDSADPIDGTNCAVLGVMNQDIWMVFNPPGDGNISLDTCEAGSFDTDLAVYTGDCEELVQVACDGDGAGLEGCQAYYSYIPSLDVLEGTTYIIRIGSWADQVAGEGVLHIAGDFDTEPECPADIDGSGSVDFADLLSVLSSWGPCSGACPADIDGNGSVDFGDLLGILSVWGPCE